MKIPTELTDAIKSENFQELIGEIGESVMDNFLDDEILKDIPLVGLLFKMKNVVTTIQDKLFAKKLLSFLKELENVPIEKRYEQINKIDSNSEYKTKVGEKLLFIINNCEDSEKSKVIGKIFKAFLEEKINYDDFLRSSNCINKINYTDFEIFLKRGITSNERGNDAFLNAGLLTFKFTKPKMVRDTYFGGDYGIIYETSEIGRILLRILCNKRY